MDAVNGVLLVFLAVAIVLATQQLLVKTTWPIVRPRLEATWPMRPGVHGDIEGFVGAEGAMEPLQSAQGITTPELKAWLPAPETVTKPSVGPCPRTLSDAGGYEAGVGKPFKSYDLLDDWLKPKPEPRVAGGPTAQQCYDTDYMRTLERAGSYAQRTNNYRMKYPDSCSAPYHELILNYYVPTPEPAPYQV
jgi:hypothetical protein